MTSARWFSCHGYRKINIGRRHKKRTSGISPKPSKNKAYVFIANSRTRRTLDISLSVPSKRRETKSLQVSKKSLDPDCFLRKRLTQGKHWTIETMKTKPRWKLHCWAIGKKYRAQLMNIKECNITWSIHWLFLFHIIKDLVGEKENLS